MHASEGEGNFLIDWSKQFKYFKRTLENPIQPRGGKTFMSHIQKIIDCINNNEHYQYLLVSWVRINRVTWVMNKAPIAVNTKQIKVAQQNIILSMFI
jgi:hypothetical protein